MDITRICRVCGKEKTLVKENFGPTGPHTFLWKCRKCVAASSREYNKIRPKRVITEADRKPPDSHKPELKMCTKCKKLLLENIDNFRWNPERQKFRASCKKCDSKSSSEYSKKNKVKRKLYMDAYHTENKDILNEKKKMYRIEHPEKDAQYWISHANFETYAPQLTIEEDPIKGANGILLVKCTYCGKYFPPTNRECLHRTSSLKSNALGERRLYCSDGCKSACPIYYQNEFPKGFKPATSREVDPLIRKMCLARDNYTCQKCGKTIDEIEIHSHHIEGAVQQPMLANDVGNTITLCINCHHWVHRQPGCTTYDLRCK